MPITIKSTQALLDLLTHYGGLVRYAIKKVYASELVTQLKTDDPNEDYHHIDEQGEWLHIYTKKAWLDTYKHYTELKVTSTLNREASVKRDKAREKAIIVLCALLSCSKREGEARLNQIITNQAWTALKTIGISDEEINIIKERGY